MSMLRRCKNCGFGNVGEVAFCGQCGFLLPPATLWQRHKTAFILSIVGGLFAIGAIGNLLEKPKESAPKPLASFVSSPTPASPTPTVAVKTALSPSPTASPSIEAAKPKETKTQNHNSVVSSTLPETETKTKTTPQKSKPRLSSAGGYIRGPRGGCYYFSSGGSKVYVDRSLCN